MTLTEYYIVYPEGEKQEIPGLLQINQVVDLNGNPLRISWPPPKVIAYRIHRISTQEERGYLRRYHYAELMSMAELQSYARGG